MHHHPRNENMSRVRALQSGRRQEAALAQYGTLSVCVKSTRKIAENEQSPLSNATYTSTRTKDGFVCFSAGGVLHRLPNLSTRVLSDACFGSFATHACLELCERAVSLTQATWNTPTEVRRDSDTVNSYYIATAVSYCIAPWWSRGCTRSGKNMRGFVSG